MAAATQVSGKGDQSAIAARGGTVRVTGTKGHAGLILVCEHASNFIPESYEDLGLDAAALSSHIAWDPGAEAVALALSAKLDAPLVAQQVSRLVYDCNRPPESPAAMPAVSEIYHIPGNERLDEAERQRRVSAFYLPFEGALAGIIADRLANGHVPALVTIHTFNPRYLGQDRPYEVGILHDLDRRLADLLLARLQAEKRYDVRRNQPYGPADGVTHTLRTHALPHRLPNVMIELRNDLVAGPADAKALADWLAPHLQSALAALDPAAPVAGAANA